MTENKPSRQDRLTISWANEFFLLHQRDFWYHIVVTGMLATIITLQVIHWFGRF